MRKTWPAITGLGIAWALTVGAVCAQDYPARIIRIVTSPPGGSNDFAARLLVRGFEMDVITGVYAPSGTPAAIVSRLNEEIVRAIKLADIKEKFSAIGIETVGTSPQELTAWMKAEIARTSRLVREGGIRGE